MNAFHYVMSTNNQRAKEEGAEPLLCYELSSRYSNRDASQISWNYVPLVHPTSCMLPKAQGSVVVSEDFLKIESRSSAFPMKIPGRSSAVASCSVVENSSSTKDHFRTCHGKGVPLEGLYSHLEAGSADPRESRGDIQRLGVYGLDVWQHPIPSSSKMRDRLPDSSSRSCLNFLERQASPQRHRIQTGDANRPGWNEKTRVERSSNDGASKVGDGKAQNDSTLKFNRMNHFREKLSLLQQQQQESTQKFDEHLKPRPPLESTAAKEGPSLADKPESKTEIRPDEKHSSEPESRPHGNEDRQDEGTLPIFPHARAHEALFQRALLEETVGSGQKKSVSGGCSDGGCDPRSVSDVLHDKIWSRSGGKCSGDVPGTSEPMDTQADDRTDSTNLGDSSPDIPSGSGRTRKRRKRVRRHQTDDRTNPDDGEVEPMSTDEPNDVGQMKTGDARGTKRLTISHHGSPELKKARSCQAHDPPPIGLSHDAYHPVGRKPSKTSIGSMSPTRAARPNGPFGSLVAPMSKQDTLSSFMWDFYERHRQSKEMYVNKIRLRDELYAVMKTVFPYCGLYIIGSSMNGFGSDHSDMDLCLMLSHNEIDQKKEAIDILRVLKKTLSLCSFLQDIKLIQAKVPILKFTDSISRVECDLNINNPVGIRNTHLLNAYSSLDWRVPPLVLFVKQWAKSWDIKDASQGTISSYSLALMIIHYLQQGCHPHLLPSLQQKYPHKFDETTDIRSLTLNEKLAPYSSPNKQSLGELFVGFIDYFTNRFSFQKEAISVRLGRAVPQSLVFQFLPKLCTGQWKYICIEEPFKLTNTAYSVFDNKVFRRIVDVFRGTNSLLVFGDALSEPSCIIKEIKDSITRNVRGSILALGRPSTSKGDERSTIRETRVAPPIDEATAFTTVDIFTAGTLTVPKSSQDLRVALIAPLASPAAVATDAAAVVNGGMNVAILAPLIYRSRWY